MFDLTDCLKIDSLALFRALVRFQRDEHTAIDSFDTWYNHDQCLNKVAV